MWENIRSIYAYIRKGSCPRRYVSQNEAHVIFYSGLPVNPNGNFPAHRAEALDVNWDKLQENIEGQYFIVRATVTPPKLEIQSDILGLEHAFYYKHGNSWLISNSVELIQRVSEPRPLDPVGVSLFLSMGWAGDDHTLRSDIKVVPPGQHWLWQGNDSEPKRRTYYSLSRLTRKSRQKLKKFDLQKLTDALIKPLKRLDENFADISCGLTGGKDTRLLAALLIHAGIPIHYYTQGQPSGTDAQIAKIIAKDFNLSYKVRRITASDVIRDWEKGCLQIMRQADGMRPLHLMSSVLAFQVPQVTYLNVRLSGAGGEIARGHYSDHHLYLKGRNLANLKNYLIKKRLRNYEGLIRKDAIAISSDYLIRFVDKCMDQGCDLLDIPDVLYAYQRVARRAGNLWRAVTSFRDCFSPFCTRAFVEASFSLPPLQRTTEPLHYGIIRSLSKELHKIPFDKSTWCTQHSTINLLKSYGGIKLKNNFRRFSKLFGLKQEKNRPAHIVRDNMFDRLGWFEAKREEVREVCLSTNDSILWNFIDRGMFDRITSSATDQKTRVRNLKALYLIATLFYYDADGWRQGEALNHKV